MLLLPHQGAAPEQLMHCCQLHIIPRDMSDTTVEEQERRRKKAAQRSMKSVAKLRLSNLNATLPVKTDPDNCTLLSCCHGCETTGVD